MKSGQVGKHSAPRATTWTRPKAAAAIASVVVLIGVAGGAIAFAATRGPSASEKRAHAVQVAQRRATAAAKARSDARTALLDAIRISPAPGAQGVPLDDAVTVAVGTGTLQAVEVTSSSGIPLAGALTPATGEWRSTGSLLPATVYTVTVGVTGNGISADRRATFTTLTPVTTVEASAYPSGGMTVGVGQPVILGFNHDVVSKDAQKEIVGRLTVAMSTPVPGAWYWFSDHELHFRPHQFWPAHETVKVVGDLGGIDLGGGRWTAGSIIDSFQVGDARVAYANLASEVMTVTEDGRTLYTFPISGGRPQYPTMNGTHIVMDRESVVHMVSSTVGIPVKSPNGYDELVYDDVHISDSGEYVHAAPWSVSSQGVTNVSHGCINLSPSNAKSYYDLSRVGDVVEVTGSSRPPAWGDHGVMDWSGPAWSQWLPANIVPIAPPASTTTSAPSTTTSTPTTTGHSAGTAATTSPATVAPATPTTAPGPSTTAARISSTTAARSSTTTRPPPVTVKP